MSELAKKLTFLDWFSSVQLGNLYCAGLCPTKGTCLLLGEQGFRGGRGAPQGKAQNSKDVGQAG
jgi:hypothetical protein